MEYANKPLSVGKLALDGKTVEPIGADGTDAGKKGNSKSGGKLTGGASDVPAGPANAAHNSSNTGKVSTTSSVPANGVSAAKSGK